MSTRDEPLPIERLMEHRAWVRGLALALTADPNDAEDVQQQTWLVALRSPPRTGVSPRGWLGTVARNIVRQRGRQVGMQTRHAAAVAHSQSCESEDPAVLTARAELHATVVAAVVALDEPYRRAILLRHFEALSVTDVAHRMGTPLETARARLRRGRALLRSRLAGEFGNGPPLAAVLAPLTTSGRTGASAAGGTLMSTKILASATVAALVVGALWWAAPPPHGEGAAPERQVVGESARATESAPQQRENGPVVAPSDDHDDPVETHADDDAHGAATATQAATAGSPAPTEPVAPLIAASSASGPARAAEIDDAPIGERLARPIKMTYADAVTARTILGRISFDANFPIDIDVRVAASIDNAKTTINLGGTGGNPEDGIEARDAVQFLSLISSVEVVVLDGRIALVRKGERWSEDIEVERILPIAKERPPEPVPLRGRVVDQDGNAVGGATIVGVTRSVVRTGADGRFACAALPQEHHVVAEAPGFVPSQVVVLTPPFDAAVEVEFVLGPPAAEIVVRVVGPGQVALDGVHVRVVSPNGGDVRWTASPGAVASFPTTHPGAVRVLVSAPRHVPVERSVHVAPRERLELEFELTPRLLSERVRDERTSLHVRGDDFAAAVATAAELWSMRLELDRYLLPETRSREVSVEIEDATIGDALRTLCDAVDAIYRVDDNADVIRIEMR